MQQRGAEMVKVAIVATQDLPEVFCHALRFAV